MMNEFDKQKLYDSYATALSKAWESYIKLVDLLLGLAGATGLVFVVSIKIADWSSLPNKGFIIYVFLSSGLAMVSGACWRFASQYFMEYEMLGSDAVASNYFGTRIESVTTAHQLSDASRRRYRACFRLAPWVMGGCLLAAWALTFLVFFGDSVATPARSSGAPILQPTASNPLPAQAKPSLIDEDLVRATTVAYNLTLVFLTIGAAISWSEFKKKEIKQAKKNFLACTERYMMIQKLIISSDHLNDLNLSIYQHIQDKPINEVVFGKELALAGMMFQLMEDVWLMHGLESREDDPLLAGWLSLFSDWMKTERIAGKWHLIKHPAASREVLTALFKPLAFSQLFAPRGGELTL